MTIKINKDQISGGVLILISILFLAVLIPEAVQVPRGEHLAVLSPDFWIKIIVWTLLALGLILFAEGVQIAKKESASAQDDVTESDYRSFPASLIIVTLAIALLFLFYFGIVYLGMLASSIIALIVFIRLSGENRWKIIIPIALIQPILLYYFFLKVAGIPMPLGIFDL